MTITETNLPKAAATLVADAKAAGMEVRVSAWGSGCEVYIVSRPFEGYERSVTVNWSEKNVAGMNSMLGFATTYKSGVRFDFASGMVKNGDRYEYPVIRSARQARFVVGLPV